MWKIANKNTSLGYCPLDINLLVPIANIPSLSESQITNLSTDLGNCEKSANKNVASGYCPLDSNSLVPTANIPQSYITQVNGKTTIDNSVVLDLSELNDVYEISVSNNQALIYNSTASKWKNQQIDHTTLSNIGTHTHSQIDTFISSEGQPSGLATLDSTSKLSSSQIPTLNLGSNLSDCVISSLSNNQGLIYNSGTSKWNNQTISHLNISNIGTNTHAQIDTFISSLNQASGIAPLNSNSKVPLNNIEQDMSIDLLSNSLAAFVDKNSINNIGDNFYNHNQNYPLT